MATLINNWFKRMFTHHASSDVRLQTSTSNRSYHKDKTSITGGQVHIDQNCLLDETITDRCTIVDKPSTMFDADAMHCDDEQKENKNILLNNPTVIEPSKKNTIVIDKFQACFIDCTCQCQARKIIPQINTTNCNNIKSQLIEELFQQINGPSYEIDCCCDCGKKGMRKLKFNYATGDKTTHC